MSFLIRTCRTSPVRSRFKVTPYKRQSKAWRKFRDRAWEAAVGLFCLTLTVAWCSLVAHFVMTILYQLFG